MRDPLGKREQMFARATVRLIEDGLDGPGVKPSGAASLTWVTMPMSFSLRKGATTRAPRCGGWPSAEASR